MHLRKRVCLPLGGVEPDFNFSLKNIKKVLNIFVFKITVFKNSTIAVVTMNYKVKLYSLFSEKKIIL